MIYKNTNIFKLPGFTSVDTNSLALYLGDEESKIKWHGVSIQSNEKIPKMELFKKFESLFEEIINYYEEINDWIFQPLHSENLFPWFTEGDNFFELENLKNLTIEPYRFKGFISVNTSQIKSLFKELFYYSYLTNSQDLLIFNRIKPFVIEFNQHLSLDLISSDPNILDELTIMLRKYDLGLRKYD